ncbi:MAG: type I restriction-modification system subunit M [Actinomycetia bacterium]|nr:type I restriction-modification system subunit M [Actinomycetes bacterium]
MPPRKPVQYDTNGATLGFEEKMWQAAVKLRNNMDAAEYKHVVLGLIFLKYISDAFEERRSRLDRQTSDPQSEWYAKDPAVRYEVLEDKDEYLSENVFWVPREARWEHLQANAKQPEIGQIIDDAMTAIESANISLKGVLPKNYGRPDLDKRRLGEMVDLISTIALGNAANRSRDVLGRVYEYFLGMFADAEGKRGGQFFTARCVVRLLVKMLAPYKGRVYDPCCGSGGMFVQSERFIEEHGGQSDQIAVYGQESNPTTWRLAKMNLAIRGISGNLGGKPGDSFHNDLHPDLKTDYLLANPPFNMEEWGGERLRDDIRWKYGVPPVRNANYAWIQHFIHHLAPRGIAGFVMANGSMSTNTSGEGEIRQNMIEADLVDCIVALPGQLFYNTQIPVCLWFVTRSKNDGKTRQRMGETLFIDARQMGQMVDRKHRELTEEDIARIAATYHKWRGDGQGEYEDIAGVCKASNVDEIRGHGYVLTPGRYVGYVEPEDDGEPFEEKMARLTVDLEAQFQESARLEAEIRENLKRLMGHG